MENKVGEAFHYLLDLTGSPPVGSGSYDRLWGALSRIFERTGLQGQNDIVSQLKLRDNRFDIVRGAGSPLFHLRGGPGDLLIDSRETPYEGVFQPAEIIKIENGQSLYRLPDEGVILSTVTHDCTDLGCGPAAMWAYHNGTADFDEITYDLMALHEHKAHDQIDGGGIVPADTLAHMLRYQGMKVDPNPYLMNGYEDPAAPRTGIFGVVTERAASNEMEPTKHVFATLDGVPVVANAKHNYHNHDDLLFVAAPRSKLPKPYRGWDADQDKVSRHYELASPYMNRGYADEGGDPVRSSGLRDSDINIIDN